MTDPSAPLPAEPEPQRSDQQPGSAPALRASDADRERTVALLREAAGDGRIDVEELDERTSAAYATRTLAELELLTQDLVATPSAAPQRPESGIAVRPGPGGARWIIAIMGGHDRSGRWRVAPRCLVLSIMGGADLDLCDAELSDRETTIHVISIMGGSELRFPSGVDVRVSKFALMGGHDVKLDVEPPPPGAPVVHLKMLALMGGSEVRQGRKRRKRSRRDRELADGD